MLHTIQDLVIETLRGLALSLSTFDGRVNCGMNRWPKLLKLPEKPSLVARVAVDLRSLKGKIVVVVEIPGLSRVVP